MYEDTMYIPSYYKYRYMQASLFSSSKPTHGFIKNKRNSRVNLILPNQEKSKSIFEYT